MGSMFELTNDYKQLLMMLEDAEDADDKQANKRMLKLYKNRLFGIRNMEGIKCEYDTKSKRIYENGSKVQKEKIYGWTKGMADEWLEPPSEELPFH